MVKNKKSIFYIGAIALALATTACNRLDYSPLSSAAQGDLAGGGTESAVFGLYGQLRADGISAWNKYWFQNIRSDDAAKGSNAGDAASFGQAYDNFNYSKSDGISQLYWNDHYALIYSCNSVIIDIDASGKTDAYTQTLRAEAAAIRAWAYFELRRDFGEVPLIDFKVNKPTDAAKAKSPIADIDAFIEKDLTSAIPNLPVTWNSSFTGRATKGFAQAVLAKLYLYQGKYAQCLTQSQNVINSGVYSLVPKYSTLFSKAGNNCSESIFEVQFLYQNSSVDYSNNYWVSQGVRGSGDWNLGWGFNVPTTSLISEYEAGDPRKDATILVGGQNDGFGNTVPTSPPLDQPYWNKKALTDPADRKALGQAQNHWYDVKIMRYAEVLLMAAEAANETGNSALALQYLEQVRSRARNGNTAVLPMVISTGQAAVRAAIKHERRVELAMENERFYDLVRWGDAPSVLGPLGYQPKNQYYPIPQSAIDNSQGKLVQNPNY